MLLFVGEADAAKETRESRGLMQPRAGAPSVCPRAQKLLGKSSEERAGKRFQILDKTEVDKRYFFGKVLLNPTKSRRRNIVRMQHREHFLVKGSLKLKLSTGKLK